MPVSSLDNLCRSFAGVVSNVAMQAEHVAAKRAVTRHTRDDGMVKIELILTNDEAAMAWAAINAGTTENATTSDVNQNASAEASAPAAATSRATLMMQRADTVDWYTKVVFVLKPIMRPVPTAIKLGVFSTHAATWFRHNRSERPAAWTGYTTTMHCSPSPRGPTRHWTRAAIEYDRCVEYLHD
jgi:hypothetical protein